MNEHFFYEIGEEFQAKYGTNTGQMFGKPCIKINNKAFAAFFKDEMVFKLGKENMDEYKVKHTGSVNWDPSGKGRAMKDWLQVPAAFKGDWNGLAEIALQYVKGL